MSTGRLQKVAYYEAGTTLKTHPHISYNDGVRRIFLYVDGKLPEDAGEDEKSLMKLLHYIGSSTKDNVTDDATKKLDDIVRRTKSKEDVGVRYMKSWEREKELREEGELRQLISLVCKKLAKGKDSRTIAEELEEDNDSYVTAIVSAAQGCAPDYDPEAVYEAYINTEIS